MTANDNAAQAVRTDILWVHGQLPSLNQLMFGKLRAKMRFKKEAQARVALFAQAVHLQPWTGRVHLHYELVEPDMRRDPGNVYGGADKCVCDALVQCGVLAGDGWKHIAGPASYEWRVDRERPGVLITLSSAPIVAKVAA